MHAKYLERDFSCWLLENTETIAFISGFVGSGEMTVSCIDPRLGKIRRSNSQVVFCMGVSYGALVISLYNLLQI